MYDLAGGAAGIRRLTDRFYALVFADALLAPLFHEHGVREHEAVEAIGQPPDPGGTARELVHRRRHRAAG